MSGITTHVLDTVLGKPAAGVAIRLERCDSDVWTAIASSTTDGDGRCRDLMQTMLPGLYRLSFDTGAYLASLGRTTIYPHIAITFVCGNEGHYHLPLLLSDNSYTTYRGS